MAGGLIQLAAYGSENEYIHGNPQMTFFKMVYRRHSNFSMESIEVVTDGPKQLSWDDSINIKIKIPRNADLISNMYLKCKLPEIYSPKDKKFEWIPLIGLYLIDHVSIYIGGQKIETLYSEYLDLYNQLSLNEQKYELFKNMVSHDNTTNHGYSDKSIDNNEISKYYNSIPTLDNKILNIPLSFWFTKYPGLSLPLIAIQYNDVELDIQLKAIKDLYTVQYFDKTYHYYIDDNRLKGTSHLSENFKNTQNATNPSKKSREHAASRTSITGTPNQGLGQLKSYVRRKPGDNEHISIFTNRKYNSNQSWDLDPVLDINYIFLDNDERNTFAQISHEYLIEQVTRIEKKGLYESSIINIEAYHPVKEIFFTIKRNDREQRNAWNNTSNLYNNNSNNIYKYQNWWWEHCNNLYNNPQSKVTFTHPGLGSEITCDAIQEFIFRFGPNGEASIGNQILNYSISQDENLYTLDNLNEFINDIWKYVSTDKIPVINKNNYKTWIETPLKSARIKFNGMVRLEERDVTYFRDIQVFQHHCSALKQPAYIYSFAIDPEKYQPSGAVNLSRIKNIEFDLKMIDPPMSAIQKMQPGKNQTRDWEYDVYFYIVNYNILKIASGLGGLVFAN